MTTSTRSSSDRQRSTLCSRAPFGPFSAASSRRSSALALRDLLAARDLGLDLDEIFDLAHYTRHAREVIGRLEAVVPSGVTAAA